MLRNVLFDLDGTLTDSAPGILHSLEYMTGRLGLATPPPEVLRSFVGPPLEARLGEVFGMNHDEAMAAILLYREYFTDKGLYENALYPGVEEMLQTLKDSDFSLFLATSKPHPFAERILAHFGLSGYFTDVLGAFMDESGPSKREIIATLLTRNQLSPGESAMVGDRKYDMLAAAKNRVLAIGAAYGYAAPGELEEAGVDYLAADVPALQTLLLRLGGPML